MFSEKKSLLVKAATIKRFEYLPLGIQLKRQTEIAKEQYQRLDQAKVVGTDKKEKPIIKREAIVKKYVKKHYIKFNLQH